MLEIKITNKEQLINLLKDNDIKTVIAKDLRVVTDIDEVKRNSLLMMKECSVTVFVVGC